MSVENVNPDHAQEGIETAKEKSTVPVDGSGTFAARWRNNFNAVFSRLSPEDEAQWYHSEELRRWPKSLLDCQKRKTYIMKYSKMSSDRDIMFPKLKTPSRPSHTLLERKDRTNGWQHNYGDLSLQLLRGSEERRLPSQVWHRAVREQIEESVHAGRYNGTR